MENVRKGWLYIRVWVRIIQYICMDWYSCFIIGNKFCFILRQLQFCLYVFFGGFNFQSIMYMYGIFFLLEEMRYLFQINFQVLFFVFFFFIRDVRNMVRDVYEILEKIIIECGNMDKEKVINYVKQMQNKGRYFCDVWS